MSQPLVSIIIATYRREESLRQALVSVAKQTYQKIEVILVDDNANEKWNSIVSKIIKAFIKNYPQIQLNYIVNKKNEGSAETRNIGIRAANGSYITFLDDDDLYLEKKIEKQLSHMLKEQSDYNLTDLYLYNDKEKLVDKRIRNYIERTDQNSLLQYHFMYHMTGTDTLMFKKKYLLSIGGFPPIDSGDEFYLIHEAIKGNGSFSYLPECDVKAFIHIGEENLSSGDSKIKGENALFEYKKQFFSQLDNSAKKYICMRHYAVLAFAELRRKHYISFFVNGFKSFISAPFPCIFLLKDRLRKKV